MSPGIVVREPEVAIAVGRCVNARSLGYPGRLVADHEADCGWCDYPVEILADALRDFVAWADFDDRSNTTGHHVLRTFAELPRDQQRELARVAQAFPAPADLPVPPGESPPAPDVDEEPAWLTQPIPEEAAP